VEHHSASLSIEDQLAELRALCVGLYDMMNEHHDETNAEIARLRDANALMQRTIEELLAALGVHLPTLGAHLPVQAAHRPVPGSRATESDRTRERDTTDGDAG
jgi:hypothetical protein